MEYEIKEKHGFHHQEFFLLFLVWVSVLSKEHLRQGTKTQAEETIEFNWDYWDWDYE